MLQNIKINDVIKFDYIKLQKTYKMSDKISNVKLHAEMEREDFETKVKSLLAEFMQQNEEIEQVSIKAVNKFVGGGNNGENCTPTGKKVHIGTSFELLIK